MDRRRFLAGLGALAAGVALRPWPLSSAMVSGCAAVEHTGTLERLLFTYDQASAPHLLREIVSILRHAPPGAVTHVLVSRARAEEAALRLSHFGLANFRLLPSDEEDVSGDWGRDILQLGCGGAVCVPWTKSASTRDDLERGYRQLSQLEGPDLQVRLLPVAAEGGNLHVDRRDGRTVLFAGTTIAVETRALYLAFHGVDPGVHGVADILRDGLGVDEVVWLGNTTDGEPGRQAALLFHIDMGCAIVAPGTVVVARCDPDTLNEERHRGILQAEADRTAAALARRGVMARDWPPGLDLPENMAERDAFLSRRLEWERAALREAAAEMERLAEVLDGVGYHIRRLEAAPERVRRFQSHTNVIPSRDRLLMPLFPDRERVHGWTVRGERGRDAVDIELGIADSEFTLGSDNLAAFELYRELCGDVRTVRDYFYLAGGNVHCVIGRLS